jgi:hypothetical protein
MLAVPGWGALQRRFEERAEARLGGRTPPGFPVPGGPPVLRSWARFLRSLLRALLHKAPATRTEVLIFTLAGKGAAEARDAYFGSLADWLQSARVTTVYLAAGAETSLPGSAARIPLEAYASAGDVLAAWSEGRRAKLATLPAEPDHAALAAALAAREVASGDAFMHALMRRAFATMLAALQPRVLVYPFENRAWEKSLVAAARAAGVGRVVGYQHSSITPRHLAFEGAAEPLPDAVITVGAVTAQWLRERSPALAGHIIEGASLRRGTAAIPLPAAHGLLVAISSNRDEALALIARVHAAAPSLQVPVVIRSHPTIPAADLFAHFAWPAHVRLSSGGPLEQDLGAATMVAYSSSTVALEGMLHGRLPVFVDIGDLPAADPLIGECDAKSSVADGAGLAAAVDAACRLGAAELEAKRIAARRYAENYLREPDAPRVRTVVDTILAGEGRA